MFIAVLPCQGQEETVTNVTSCPPEKSSDKHEWIGYYDGDGDLSKASVFCIPCVLFPTVHRDGSRRADNLITKLHRNFKKISGDADIHGGLQYHADSMFKLKDFTFISANL